MWSECMRICGKINKNHYIDYFMSKKRLSIIIPCYNVSRYMANCLESIDRSAQSYIDRLEVIAVNDGSTDDTLQILNELKNLVGGVKIVNKENGGVSSARNRGIEEATGEYIWFIDPDDDIEPESIPLILQQLDKEASDCLLFDYNFLWTETKPKKEGTENALPQIRKLGQKEILSEIVQPSFGYSKEQVYNFFQGKTFAQQTFLSGGVVWNMVVKRSIITENELLFDSKLVIHQDGMFVLDMFCYVHNVIAMYAKLYNYYYRPTGNQRSVRERPELLSQVKMALVEERVRINELYKQCHQRDFTTCYDGSLFFSAMELCIKLSREKYSNHLRIFLDYVALQPVKDAIGRIDTSQVPLKYKLPVLLLTHGYYRTLFTLVYLAQHLGYRKRFKKMFSL